VFGRKSQVSFEPVDPEDFVDDLDPEDRALEDAELLAEIERRERLENAPVVNRPQGPWDVADAPDRPEDQPLLDLGGLLVPVPPDCEVRVDVSPENEVVAATIVRGDSALQVNAFAAPRSEGIWGEVRGEIAEALSGGGGRADEATGPFGPELRAAVPTEVPGQGVVLADARFLGVDGPRWFLRGLITGPAATDDALAAPLEAALRDVVVVRGTDPMAVRDPLPLRLPRQVTDQQAAEAGDGGDEAIDGDDVDGPSSGHAEHIDGDSPRGIAMPERGPEITEIR
jgi:hypothetical protein